MSHIFISYSRRDLDFVQQIVDALAASEVEAWVDWKSIPKGEDWEQEIYRGIEAADAFLFLISPDSIQSKMCNKEVLNAMQNRKRILPILIRDTRTDEFLDASARAEIKRLNWVYCRKDLDNFADAVDKVRETIRTDYEWVRFHTNLQTKALAWERTQHEKSRLLRGRELTEAQQQIARAGQTKEPPLTDIQKQYLQRSEQVARSQRRLPLTVALSLIGLGILSVAWLNKSWYNFWPLPSACPALMQIAIDFRGEGLPAESQKRLEQAIKAIPAETVKSSCAEQPLSETPRLEVNASPLSSVDQVQLQISLPQVPAYRMDFLPEVRTFQPETVSFADAATLIRAATEYSLGNYEQVISTLKGQAGAANSFSGLTLLAQSYLFLDTLEESRGAYARALEKSTAGSETFSRLNMGAALAYWRPLLYDNAFTGKARLCAQAKNYYAQVKPWEGAAAYVHDVQIVYGYEFHCNDLEWKDAPELTDPADPDAQAAASFIVAKRCGPYDVVTGCDYLAELQAAQDRLLSARSLLIRHYYQRVKTDNCQSAEPFLKSFLSQSINPRDRKELRTLLRIKAMNCPSFVSN